MAALLYAAVRVSSHAQRNPGRLSTQCLLLGWLCQRDGERAGRLFRICIPPTLDKKLFFFRIHHGSCAGDTVRHPHLFLRALYPRSE